ncbi:MAG: hypothetical protein WB711_03880 [Terriglobales bacterium]
MNSWQTKLGSFCENWNAASLALSIKGSEGVSELVGAESAGRDAAGGGSGQGGGAGSVPRFKMGGASEQGGVLGACDWAAGGVTKANAKATTTPAKRSQRPIG